MDDQATLREILERNAGKVRADPSLARHTGRTTVRLRPGLECEVSDGSWRLTVGMGEQSGGNNAGPSPGTLGRGGRTMCNGWYALSAREIDGGGATATATVGRLVNILPRLPAGTPLATGRW